MTTTNEDKETTGQIEVDTPHDGIVQRFFRETETAKSFFKEYLPPKIVELLDLDSLKYVKDKFVDKVMGKYSSDCLYKVNFKVQLKGYIFLLLEHKSWPYRLAAFQALKYIVRIWEDYLANNKNAKYLPPVITVVLYHGERKWKLGNRFSILYDKPGPLKMYMPDFRCVLLDISHSPDKKIKGIPLLKILLMSLKYIFKPQLRNKLREIFGLFKKIESKENAMDYLETLVRYFMSSAGNLGQEEIEGSVSEIFSEGGELMGTIAEKLKNEGKSEGKWEMVMNMLRNGTPIDFIVEISGFTVKQINEFKEKMQGQQLNVVT